MYFYGNENKICVKHYLFFQILITLNFKMNKLVIALALGTLVVAYSQDGLAQSKKQKKSRYYQNNPVEAEFDVKGFHREPPKNEVERKPIEEQYDVKIDRNERDGKYRNEKRVRPVKEKPAMVAEKPKKEKKKSDKGFYYTSYGQKKYYSENRKQYDKYYDQRQLVSTPPPPPLLNKEEIVITSPAIAIEPKPKKKMFKLRKEREVKMTSEEQEYKTTVVKKRYTNLDVLCDDLDLAKIQRPVFKGICSECARDVDAIIINKNMSSLEKNYMLKQSYMMRDKRLRDTLDDDQYKKWNRIKDSDEYLVITKDLELKDGVDN
jgi:hypothetical protein